MFIKKTNCGKFLVTLTAKELSGLRSISSWYKSVTNLIRERNQSTSSEPYHGNVDYTESMLQDLWAKTIPFKDDIINAG